MAGFRGVADTATDVKVKQDQMAQQEELARLQVAASMATANANRDENARQANMSAAQQKANLAEGARRFDVGVKAQAQDTAWAQSQAEAKAAEDTRRFDLGEQAAARGEQRAERQLSLQEFGTLLAQRRESRAEGREDIASRMASAQLDQYLAATDEEKQAKANRDRIAKGAFGSLVIAGRLNGGVMPTKALEIANQELGDKNTQITGGGFDEETGIAFFNMTNLQTGETRQLKMTPENQYSAIHAGIGKQEADMFYETFKTGSSVRAGIERRRMELQDAADVETRKYAARQELAANNPLKKVELLQKQADNYMKLAETDPASADEYRSKASVYQKQVDKLLMGEKEGTQKQFVIPQATLDKLNIPTGYKINPTPNPDGSIRIVWRDNEGRPNHQDFTPDGTPLNAEIGKPGGELASRVPLGTRNIMKNATGPMRSSIGPGTDNNARDIATTLPGGYGAWNGTGLGR